MLSVCVLWNIFQGVLRCPSSLSTQQQARILCSIFSFKKTSLQEQKCDQRSGHCIPDFKFTLQINLTLLISYLLCLNSTIALFTACPSLDNIQGWIVLWAVHCTQRHCHTFRWVSSGGPAGCCTMVWGCSHHLARAWV